MTRPDIRRQWNANAPAWTELSRAGLDVYRDLVNTRADEETAAARPQVADTRIAPYFLIVRARKP